MGMPPFFHSFDRVDDFTYIYQKKSARAIGSYAYFTIFSRWTPYLQRIAGNVRRIYSQQNIYAQPPGGAGGFNIIRTVGGPGKGEEGETKAARRKTGKLLFTG